MWILIVFIVVAFGFYLLIDDSILHFFFQGDSTKTNGDLLTVYISVIGGLGTIYGFYVKNEQDKKNRNSQTFSDGIVKLKDSSLGVALNGAEMLFQLAQNDISYKENIATIFCEYIDKTSSYYKKDLSKALVKYLFQTDAFKNLSIEINKAEIDCFNIYIESFEKIVFNNCKISNAVYRGIPTLEFEKCEIGSISFYEVCKLTIKDSKIDFLNISNCNILKWIFLLDCTILGDSSIDISKQIIDLHLNGIIINKSLTITSPAIEHKTTKRITGNLIIK
jgi:hypothetical protein